MADSTSSKLFAFAFALSACVRSDPGDGGTADGGLADDGSVTGATAWGSAVTSVSTASTGAAETSEGSTTGAESSGSGQVDVPVGMSALHVYPTPRHHTVYDAIAVGSDTLMVGLADWEAGGAGTERQAHIMRVDTDGNALWNRAIGGGRNDQFFAVTADATVGTVAIGLSRSFTGATAHDDVFVVTMSDDGAIDSAQTLGTAGRELVFGVATLLDGGLVAAGVAANSGGDPEDGMVMRLGPDLSVVWARRLGGPEPDELYDIAVEPSGTIWAVGYRTISGARDGWAVVLSDTGQTEQAFLVGESGDDTLRAVAIAPSGDVIVAGESTSFGAGAHDAIVLVLNPAGNAVGVAFGDEGYDSGTGVAITPDGDVIVSGVVSVGGDPRDVFAAQVDLDAQAVTWIEAVGDPATDLHEFGGIHARQDGGLAYGAAFVDPDTADAAPALVFTNSRGQIEGGCDAASTPAVDAEAIAPNVVVDTPSELSLTLSLTVITDDPDLADNDGGLAAQLRCK